MTAHILSRIFHAFGTFYALVQNPGTFRPDHFEDLAPSTTLSRPSYALSARSVDQTLEFNSNWTGTVLGAEDGDRFTSVTGTFTLPSSVHHASAWVGIDGDACQSTLFRAGVDFSADEDGAPMFEAWYQWYPADAATFDDLQISVGDTVVATVTATSTDGGVATIKNTKTGQEVTHVFSDSPALCLAEADWIVENHEGSTSSEDLTFTNSFATKESGKTVDPTDSSRVTCT